MQMRREQLKLSLTHPHCGTVCVCVCFHSCVRFGWIGWMKRSPLAAGVRGGPRSSIWRVPGFQGCRKPGRIHAWQFHTRSIRVRSARQKREKLCFFSAPTLFQQTNGGSALCTGAASDAQTHKTAAMRLAWKRDGQMLQQTETCTRVTQTPIFWFWTANPRIQTSCA